MISAVLLVSEADEDSLVGISKQINEQSESLIKLNERFLPHITLVQFKAPDEAAEKLWHSVESWKDYVGEVNSGGLNFAFSPEHNQTWIELQFLKSAALANLQNEILKTGFAEEFEAHNDRSDRYRPHCTLGLLNGLVIPKLRFTDNKAFGRKFFNLTLAVGINGEHFTFGEVKFS